MNTFDISELLFYFVFVSFAGWTLETAWAATKNHHFINKGFLNLPFSIPYGIIFLILNHALPTLHHHFILQWIMTFVVFHVVWTISELFVQKICGLKEIDSSNIPTLTLKTQLIFDLIASSMMVAYIVIIHPFVQGTVHLIPNVLITIVAWLFFILIIVDFFSVLYSLYKKRQIINSLEIRKETQLLTDKITDYIWKRLNVSYPGITENTTPTEYTFAKGLCLDKIIWIFLISSFLGSIIEMIYCRLAGDIWMNRSSLLYGSFSIVWGVGAVLLTICLKPISKRHFSVIFFAGFLIGGTYEYLCSVFTEILFGTVFWDYSHMWLNINGRTNVLYCFFWGILSVLWVKVLYPPMEKGIEKIPPFHGKLVTWILAFVLLLDGVLTCGAMIRYSKRQDSYSSSNIITNYFDTHYDDKWMETRWPNMRVIK